MKCNTVKGSITADRKRKQKIRNQEEDNAKSVRACERDR